METQDQHLHPHPTVRGLLGLTLKEITFEAWKTSLRHSGSELLFRRAFSKLL